ncbi:winged helix DNA-binding protein [Sphingomonas baiyangensis]|uniref:HTH marR-type domain-containing protein n=1 Tax=Sphingomonas baiyangensis TaxID=2572576 RepID=A0A4U1L8H1_9SPHN|nr:winged helix DNA-binding protein [Sphingomonas baiyangensis]TKD53272.1 hypothetical protein FBR43_02820 [Sphingomonas baiyangensis]
MMRHEAEPTVYAFDGRDERAMLVIACEGSGRADIVEAGTAAGARIQQQLDPAEAGAAIARTPRIEAIAIDLAGVPDALAEDLLTGIDLLAHERAIPVIASFGADRLDLVAARLTHPDAHLLCDPDPFDRVAAILALQTEAPRLHDAAREAEQHRLRTLNAEVARIAETLARLARSEPPLAADNLRDRSMGFVAQPPAEATPAIDAGEIRATIAARRLRARFFPADLFADPAWDMLLDLFAAHLERARVSVSSLCIAAQVPSTTALRWIKTMQEAGLLERSDDPFDRRRAFMALSQAAVGGMQAYVAATRRQRLPIA